MPAVKEGADNIVRTRLEPQAEFGVRLAIELEIQAVICALHCRERATVFGTDLKMSTAVDIRRWEGRGRACEASIEDYLKPLASISASWEIYHCSFRNFYRTLTKGSTSFGKVGPLPPSDAMGGPDDRNDLCRERVKHNLVVGHTLPR